MSLEHSKQPHDYGHYSPPGSYEAPPSDMYRPPDSVGGADDEITAPGNDLAEGTPFSGITPEADFSGIGNGPWTTPPGYGAGAGEITAPLTNMDPRIPEAAGTLVGGTIGVPRRRPAFEHAPPTLESRALARQRREQLREAVKEYVSTRAPLYENGISGTMLLRASKVVIAADERDLADDTLTRIVSSFLDGARNGNEAVGNPEKEVKVVVGHVTPLARHETGLVDLALKGGAKMVSADINYAKGLLYGLDTEGASTIIAETITGGAEKNAAAYAGVKDLQNRLTDIVQTVLSEDRRPTFLDYRTAMRIAVNQVDNLPPGVTPEQIVAIQSKLATEKMLEAHSSEIAQLRTFYEELTRDSPRIDAMTVQRGPYSNTTLYNIGYEGVLSEGRNNLQTMLAGIAAQVGGAGRDEQPNLVAITDVDRIPAELVPLAMEIAAHCDARKVPIIFTAGKYLQQHHQPLLNGTDLFGSHELGAEAAEILSKASGVNPELTVQNENRTRSGTKGGNAGGGNNTNREYSDGYSKSNGTNGSWGIQGSTNFGDSQTLQPGAPLMPPHEITFKDLAGEFGVWGPHVPAPRVYDTQTGLAAAPLPRHAIKPIEVEDDMRDVNEAQRTWVGDTAAISGEGHSGMPTLQEGGSRAPRHVPSTLGDYPQLVQSPDGRPEQPRPARQQPQQSRPRTSPQIPKSNVEPLELPTNRATGSQWLAYYFNNDRVDFDGKSRIDTDPKKWSRRDRERLRIYGEREWRSQSRRGLTEATWERWSYFMGVPGQDLHPRHIPIEQQTRYDPDESY